MNAQWLSRGLSASRPTGGSRWWQRLPLVVTLLAALSVSGVGQLEGSTPAPGLPAHAEAAAATGLFLNKSTKTNSASIAVDGAGGIHVAFAQYGGGGGGAEPAYYGYCASGCGDAADWAVATVSDGSSRVNEVQLALTPAGTPRLLVRAEDGAGHMYYQYAACDSGCGAAAGWQIATVATTTNIDISLWDYSQHYFALDHLGRPRFVYRDNNGVANHRGNFYAYCNSNCLNGSNWFDYRLLGEDDVIDLPSLSFTTSGQPRLAGVIYDYSPYSGFLAYLQCDANCESGSPSWSGSYLTPRGSGHATWALRLDSQDRPRMAFYQASLDGGGGNTFYYLWCDAACSDGTHWDGAPLALSPAASGDPEADLAFDSQDRPHLSYRTGGPAFGLGYAWCEANCQSASGTWHSQLAESSEVLNAEWPRPPYPGCTFSSWYGGYRSALALDPDDNPIFFYDAEHLINTGATCIPTTTDYRTVRLLVPAEASGNPFAIFLPLVRK